MKENHIENGWSPFSVDKLRSNNRKWKFFVQYLYTVFENHKKVSFNIASEASYIYILSKQKLIKNANNSPFWRVFENLKLSVKQCAILMHDF